MKTLFLFLLIIFNVAGFGQPICKLNHQHLDEIPMYKSGNESLRSDTIDVLNYSVYLDFTQATSNIISGNCEVKFQALMDINSISLDLLQLNIDSITHNGTQITYSYNDTLIVAQLPSTLTTGNTDSITVFYGGVPQTDPSGWGGFYMSDPYFYNLGVGFESDPHNYGRTWHPCFDNFIERATYDYEILTNNNFTAYCNGTRTNVAVAGTDSLLTSWELSTEIPTYLASVAVSDYTHVVDNYFSTLQSIDIPIWLTANEVDTTNLKNSFINLNTALEVFENIYGPYVWERVGYVMVPFNSGAMEHATNIAYPLAVADGSLTYEANLMAHELSHHWWGDWVTCETAEEMWINEGMASYSERLFTEGVYDYEAYMSSMRDNHYDVLHRAHINDSGFYALNAVPIKYTYGDHSYNKGADVMHTLRSYMGDALFFQGLQAVQSTFGGGNASSEQFRDEMTSSTSFDVSDFFEDWILQPGFSHFAITQMTVESNGGNYDVEIVLDQKLKGASSFHNNVPLQITFRDANWNTEAQQVSMSGDYQVFNFTLGINPVFAAVNVNERINDAITASNTVVNSIGLKDFPYSNSRLSVTSVSDSAYIRFEHNWVYPDNMIAPANVVISQDRYWNIHGIDLGNVQGSLRFYFNGKNNSTGDLDNSIMTDVGGQAFIEDSLVLLYRPDASSQWDIHSDYSFNPAGSNTDKYGFLEANTFKGGQYAIGYRTNSVEIKEAPVSALTYSIYPNPAVDTLFIDLSSWKKKPFSAEVYAINGQKIATYGLVGNQINKIPLNDLSTGSYLIILTDGQSERFGSKRIIIN